MQPATTQPRPARDALYTVADAAPLLGMGEYELFRWLRAKQYCTATSNGTVRHYNARTYITTRGMVWLREQLENEQQEHTP